MVQKSVKVGPGQPIHDSRIRLDQCCCFLWIAGWSPVNGWFSIDYWRVWLNNDENNERPTDPHWMWPDSWWALSTLALLMAPSPQFVGTKWFNKIQPKAWWPWNQTRGRCKVPIFRSPSPPVTKHSNGKSPIHRCFSHSIPLKPMCIEDFPLLCLITGG